MAKEASAGRWDHGLLVNPVRPDAIRVAPPLLVSDDEIDAGAASPRRGTVSPLSRRLAERRMPSA